MRLTLLRYLALAILVLLLDQLSKWSALSNLQMGVPEPVLPFLNWLLLFNPGAAFSFLAQGSGWQRWFFTVLGLGAAIYIVYLLYKSQSEKMLCIALSLILGGALGNVLDRIMFGVISSVSQPFCGDCSRARLSTEGRLYTCLFATAGHDLRALLRSGHSDSEIASAIGLIWQQREDRYSEIRSHAVARSDRIEMSYIGG